MSASYLNYSILLEGSTSVQECLKASRTKYENIQHGNRCRNIHYKDQPDSKNETVPQTIIVLEEDKERVRIMSNMLMQ